MTTSNGYFDVHLARSGRIVREIKDGLPFLVSDKEQAFILCPIEFADGQISELVYSVGRPIFLGSARFFGFDVSDCSFTADCSPFFRECQKMAINEDFSGLKDYAFRNIRVANPQLKLISDLARKHCGAPCLFGSAINVEDIALLESKFNLLNVDLADVEYYLNNSTSSIRSVSFTDVTLGIGSRFKFYVFRFADANIEHYALVKGDLLSDNSPIIRIHSSCYTGDLLGSLHCDCGEQLSDAVNAMKDSDNGVLFYLMQEGRGIGLSNKIRAYDLQRCKGKDTFSANRVLGFNDDERDYSPLKPMIKYFGIKSCNVITDNLEKINFLRNIDVEVLNVISSEPLPNQHNRAYLAAKSARSARLIMMAKSC